MRTKREIDRPMPRLPMDNHHYQRQVEGRGIARVESCAVCPLPKDSRIHDEDVMREIADYERRRFGD